MGSLNFQHEVKTFLEYRKTDRLWHVPAIAALSVSVPFFVGYALGYGADGVQASIGGLVSLYLHSGNVKRRMKILLFTALGFIVSFAIGLTFSFNPWVSAAVVGLLSILAHSITTKFRLPPPGNFFFIMMASIGSFLPHQPEMILQKVGIFSIGAFWACFLGFLYALYITKRFPDQKKAKTPPKPKYVSAIEAILVGVTIATSILVSHWLQLPNPYWVPISCLAVIHGINKRLVWHRSIQRIIGTGVGIEIAWLFLSLNHHPIYLGLCIMFFQFMVEFFIVRNYGLAVIFITPLTIFLAESGNYSTLTVNELMFYRLYDIAIGAAIGVIGGSLIHTQSLYAHTRLMVMKSKKLVPKKGND